MEKVKEVVAGSAVVIFSKSSCCMSHAIVTLIRSFGASPLVYDLDNDKAAINGADEMEKALMRLGCNPSVPAVFVGMKFVGGSDEIFSLNIKGKLKPLLIKANAIWM